MENDLKTLLEKVVLNDETKSAIVEAWGQKVQQVKEMVETDLRKEYSDRFEHDKETIVNALDSFISDKISTELVKVKEMKMELEAKKQELEEKGKETLEKFEEFVAKKLSDELMEFANERVEVTESVAKTEKFIVNKLQEEIAEYNQSKVKLAEERIALETEKKAVIVEAKANFIKRASALAEKAITESLRKELKELRQDIMEARNNSMGQKIFETFQMEFQKKFFNESKEVKKVSEKIKSLEEQLNEANDTIKKKDQLLTESKKEMVIIKESVERKQVVDRLLGSITAEKRPIMAKLLETVKTENLTESYKKFLPSVLGLNSSSTSGKVQLAESGANKQKIVDGNRPVKNEEINEETSAMINELKSLVRRTF